MATMTATQSRQAERQTSDASLVPLFVGVTGHRALHPDQIEVITAKVADELRGLRDEYPATPIWILTPLAEGADRIVAEAALKLGMGIVCPLPLEPAEYENDFKDGDSIKQFRTLLKRANNWFVIPLVAGNTAAEVAKPGPDRNEQYAAVGAFIARNCHILIAIWDGMHHHRVGEVAQVVGFQLAGVPKKYYPGQGPLDGADSGPVVHFTAAREGVPNPGAVKRDLKFNQGFDSEKSAQESYARILRRLNQFNQDAASFAHKHEQRIKESEARVLSPHARAGLPDRHRALLRHYAVADGLANHFRDKTRLSFRALECLAFAAAFVLAYFAHMERVPGILLIYFALIAAGWWVMQVAIRREYKNRHLDYRALAEGLRVQLFWTIAGLRERAADHYLQKQRSELDWIRYAMRSVSTATAGEPPQNNEEMVTTEWVVSEQQWFAEKAKRAGAAHAEASKSAIGGLRLAIFGTILLLAWLLIRFFLHNVYETSDRSAAKTFLQWLVMGGWNDRIEDALFTLIAMLLAFAAVNDWYTTRQAHIEQSKQYARMSGMLSLAITRIRAAMEKGDQPRVHEILLALGKEALSENGDWVILHRSRMVEQPFA